MKSSSPKIDQKSEDVLRKIGRLADDENLDVYVVGGFVRDAILGRANKDIDILGCLKPPGAPLNSLCIVALVMVRPSYIDQNPCHSSHFRDILQYLQALIIIFHGFGVITLVHIYFSDITE